MGNEREECVWRTQGTSNAHNTSVGTVNGRSRPGRHVLRVKNDFKTNSKGKWINGREKSVTDFRSHSRLRCSWPDERWSDSQKDIQNWFKIKNEKPGSFVLWKTRQIRRLKSAGAYLGWGDWCDRPGQQNQRGRQNEYFKWKNIFCAQVILNYWYKWKEI